MKTVLITGASRGIGEAIARAFSANGYNVIINYLSSEEKANALACEINSATDGEKFGFAEVYRADVSSKSDVLKMFNYVFEKYGSVDVLVNNAGVALKQKVLQDVTDGEFEKLVAVNLKGLFNCSQCVLDGMISSGEGRIINLSSVWGVSGGSCEVVYSMTKAGVIGFTKALAKELAPSSIAVNAVAPGFIDTDMNSGISLEDKLAFANDVPAGRIGTPQEVADVVLRLAGAPLYLTGQVIGIDGGLGV